MRFLIDAQLPPALARWLGERGHAARSAREAGLRDSDDGSIWNFAMSGDWIVVTKDEDFVDRCLLGGPAPAVIWIRLGNCTNQALFARLAPIMPEILRQLGAGHRLIEVR